MGSDPTRSLRCFISRTWQLYVATIAGSSFCFTLAPLFFKYTAELAYPVPEGVIGGFLTCFNNVVGGLFLSAFFIPGIGTIWMNYVIVASAVGNNTKNYNQLGKTK